MQSRGFLKGILAAFIVISVMAAVTVTQVDWSQIKNKPAYFANVKADGSTNDQPALQAQINALAVAKGGTILLPPGFILLSCGSCNELLNFPGPATVNLVGNGWNIGGGVPSGSVLVVGAGVGASTDVIHIAPGTYGMTGLVLRDFEIIPQSGTPGRNAINIDTTTHYIANLLIDHIYTAGLGGHGIVSTNPTPLTDGFFTSTIRDSFINNGVYLQNAGDSLNILRTSLTGAGNSIDATFVPGTAHFHVANNTLASAGAGVHMGSTFTACLIEENFFEPQAGSAGSNGAALDLDGSGDHCIVSSNIFDMVGSPSSSSIRVNSAAVVVIKDNMLQKVAGSGGAASIKIVGGSNNRIEFNYYVPSADNWPYTWTDAGTNTYVEPRCQPYTVSGSSLTSAGNTQTVTLSNHPANAIFTGFKVSSASGMTATNLTTLQMAIGDDCCSDDYFATIGTVVGAVQRRNSPPLAETNNGFASNLTVFLIGTYSSGSFATHPVSGTVTVNACWGLNPLE